MGSSASGIHAGVGVGVDVDVSQKEVIKFKLICMRGGGAEVAGRCWYVPATAVRGNLI